MDSYYAVLIEGRKFNILVDKELRESGFFATFHIEASSVPEVYKRVVNFVKQRIKNSDIEFIINKDVKPYILVKQIQTITKNEVEELDGFTFYTPSTIDKLIDWFYIKIGYFFLKDKILFL